MGLRSRWPRPGRGAPARGRPDPAGVGLLTIAREWGRIGCIGFGGPPAHIALLRKLCVTERGWLSADEFEDGVATTNLLPGPASTQLAIFCAWRLAGSAGALVGGACFIVPGLIVILALSALFLAAHPPAWVAAAAAGAGAAVPAVAAAAAIGLMPASWRRAAPPDGPRMPGTPRAPSAGPRMPGTPRAPSAGPRVAGRPRSWRRAGPPAGPRSPRFGWPRCRWVVYLLAGGTVAALAGPFLVLLLLGCGMVELAVRGSGSRTPGSRTSSSDPGGSDAEPGRNGPGPGPDAGRLAGMLPALAVPAVTGGLLAVAWVAFKVGALSYGGGFVIVPLMQHDAVHTYHWMTGAQFLSAVALGQITPGPVVQTVAVVGYAAAGIGGGLLASLVAFAPSFVFVLVGAPRFAVIRRSTRVQAFLTGAGPAAIGAIAGSTIPLGLELAHLWQLAVLGLAAIWLVGLRRNVVGAVAGAACLGVIAVLAGAPVG